MRCRRTSRDVAKVLLSERHPYAWGRRITESRVENVVCWAEMGIRSFHTRCYATVSSNIHSHLSRFADVHTRFSC